MSDPSTKDTAVPPPGKGPEDRTAGTILIVDDTPVNIAVLLETLEQHSFKVLVARGGDSALEQAPYAQPDLILLDVMMPGVDGFETCRRLKQSGETRNIPVIFMTALTETEDKVRAFEAGAVDYVTKPFQQDEVLARVRTHLTLERFRHQLARANDQLEQRVAERTAEIVALKDQLAAENLYLQEEIKTDHDFSEIIGDSEPLKATLHKVQQVATTDATVLLRGETGTGKELFARAIHDRSALADRPLVKVNCAALPPNLIESELFGHEKGSFTGAVARKIGRFELADRGTIFLDEIGDLPLELQAKLLRVLQEGEIERLGGTRTITVETRVIAATNRDLEAAIREGDFRQDLYYRLNVFPIVLPPLRERRGDISPLVRHFAGKYARRFGRAMGAIPRAMMAAFESYPWPGNVRELENIVERAVILSGGSPVEIEELLDQAQAAELPGAGPLRLEDVERDHIRRVLEDSGWRIEGPRGAAAVLGLNPSTLRSRLRKLGIERA